MGSTTTTLDDDCLRNIVRWTSSANTLFALARASPTLQQIVHDRLEASRMNAPNLAIYSVRARLKDPMRSIGAYLGNQYLVYEGTTYLFTDFVYYVKPWRAFLAALPMLKRIYVLCCCKRFC